MNLEEVEKDIINCNLCSLMVEKFDKEKTVSIGNRKDILIVGEAPANNGWRKSGKAFYDLNNRLLPSGIILQKLLDILDLKIEDINFVEAIKCFPKDRKYIKKCSDNCRYFLLKQIFLLEPKIILTLGDAATKATLDIKYKKYSDVVGKVYFMNDIMVIPIYHTSPISPKSYQGNEEIFYSLNEYLKEKRNIVKMKK